MSKLLKNNINYLDLTPERKLEFIVEESDVVSILFPRFTNKFLVNLISSRMKNPIVKVKLDELGSAVWLEIDGIKKVDQIINILENRLGERIEPAQERVLKFLSSLFNKKIISFKEL